MAFRLWSHKINLRAEMLASGGTDRIIKLGFNLVESKLERVYFLLLVLHQLTILCGYTVNLFFGCICPFLCRLTTLQEAIPLHTMTVSSKSEDCMEQIIQAQRSKRGTISCSKRM